MKQIYILNRRGKGSVANLQPEELYLLVDAESRVRTPGLQAVLNQENLSDKSINLADDLESPVKSISLSAQDGVGIFDDDEGVFAQLSNTELILRSYFGNSSGKFSRLRSNPDAPGSAITHFLPKNEGTLLNENSQTTSITIIADTTVALNVVGQNAYYALTGVGAIASLPPVEGNEGKTIIVVQKASSEEEVQQIFSNDSVSNDIWYNSQAVNTISSFNSITFFNDGVNWTVISNN